MLIFGHALFISIYLYHVRLGLFKVLKSTCMGPLYNKLTSELNSVYSMIYFLLLLLLLLL